MDQVMAVPTQNAALAIEAAQRKEERSTYAENIKATIAPNTLVAYKSQWKQFARWCDLTGRAAYSDETYRHDKEATEAACVAAAVLNGADVLSVIDRYLKSTQVVSAVRQRRAAQATVVQAYAAIKAMCNIVYHGRLNPCETKDAEMSLRAVCSHITNEIKGTAEARDEHGMKRSAPHPKDALGLDELRSVLNTIKGSTLADLRDRAVLLVGFAGAFRRSELTELRMSDLRFSFDAATRAERCEIMVRYSKTDQQGRGLKKALVCSKDREFCPVNALHALITAAQLSDDEYVFQSTPKGGGRYTGVQLQAQDVARIIKRRCAAAGLDCTNLAGHSLRRGFVTSAYNKGADFNAIMNQTGHRSVQTVRRYIENKDCFEHNAVATLFN